MISDMEFKKMCNRSPTMCARESIIVILSESIEINPEDETSNHRYKQEPKILH